MKPNIYLDCTNIYHSDLNTGIQRVVKNLVYNVELVSQELSALLDNPK